MREHDALGLAGSAGGVNDGRKIVAGNFRGTAAIFGDVGVTGGGDQSVVAQGVAMRFCWRELRKSLAREPEFALGTRQFFLPGGTCGENDLCA